MQRDAPVPDLRILPVEVIHPHEEHDSQRSEPLVARIRQAEWFTNPPVVAPMADGQFVVLDGANRYHCFCHLEYRHLLVQVAPYEGGFVELGVWNHIISRWQTEALLASLESLPGLEIHQGWDAAAAAQVLLRDGMVLAIHAPAQTLAERNAALRQVVRVYQRTAVLHRTIMTDTIKIWQLYPDAIALVLFPEYRPEDIIAAAREGAYLPPGISRHIIQGRALKLNYPLAALRDAATPLAAKNAALEDWVRQKLAQRGMRYYAESTYQFDE
ncbi:MAG: hypothetical protein MUE40_04930 [Anaerolineae bacterium]|jgi:hypothetical protein|nr:hypothetical protein [Anaerolineae bacterium]